MKKDKKVGTVELIEIDFNTIPEKQRRQVELQAMDDSSRKGMEKSIFGGMTKVGEEFESWIATYERTFDVEGTDIKITSFMKEEILQTNF
jgi:hypothetical protein